MEYAYLITFFRKFGIDSAISASIICVLGYLLNVISEKHPKFAKYVQVSTFLISIVVFYLTGIATKGKTSFDYDTFQGSCMAFVLSTTISVIVKSFVKTGKLVYEKKTLDKKCVEELLKGIVKEESMKQTVKSIISLKEKNENEIEKIIREFATEGVSEMLVKEASFGVAKYFAVTENKTE